MLRVSPVLILRGSGKREDRHGECSRRRGTAGLDELKDLYELNASEPEDEGEYDEKDDEDEDEEFE